jgi:hypothetical protein
MPTKKVANAEQAEEDRPQERQPDTERYLLQIDRQTKRSFRRPKLPGPWHWKSKADSLLCRSQFMTT